MDLTDSITYGSFGLELSVAKQSQSVYEPVAVSKMARASGPMSADQSRCALLSSRCFTGFSKHDKAKKNPIPEEKALQEWDELLEKRFPQPVSGGSAFVLKIAKVVKDQKTDEGLDLTSSRTILEHLAKWCERMCKEHSIDPRSEAMQALLQQAHWHEENKEDHARTRGTVEKAAKAVLGAQVAMHATVEDIASSLGVRMDKKRKKTFVRAIRAKHVSS